MRKHHRCEIRNYINHNSKVAERCTEYSAVISKEEEMGKGSSGSKGGSKGSAGWPSKTGNPSGGGRVNNPPKK